MLKYIVNFLSMYSQYIVPDSFNNLIDFYHFRSLDINTLIGNVGGYIGLLIGFSICDVPILIIRISQELENIHKIKGYFHTKLNTISLKLLKK